MIRQYPAREGKYIQGKALDERMAVQRAIDQTMKMDNGQDRLRVVDLVFFKQTHTLEGAALMDTAQKYHAQFIKLVAKNYGLLD